MLTGLLKIILVKPHIIDQLMYCIQFHQTTLGSVLSYKVICILCFSNCGVRPFQWTDIINTVITVAFEGTILHRLAKRATAAFQLHLIVTKIMNKQIRKRSSHLLR